MIAGQYTDPETGYQYLQHRYYDPATGQFLTRDPLDAQTRSAYGYVNNNPLNSTDPTGLSVYGVCVTGTFGWGLTVEGSVCQLWDSTGSSAVTYSAGGGGGLEVGGNVSGYYSNAPAIGDVMGWAACGGGGVGFLSGELCAFTGRDGNSYSSIDVAIGTGQKYGGHITALYAAKIPGWLRRFVSDRLKKAQKKAQAWIDCVQSNDPLANS